MKATGIVRRIDDLGRVVIPREIRANLNINEGDPMGIYVDKEGEIILKKYEPGCTFCGGMDDVKDFKGKLVCGNCRANMAGLQI